MIRPVTADDLPALRALIDSTGLFPGAMLDEMIAPAFAGEAEDDFWLTAIEGDAPVTIAYGAPERMTNGTWNLYLIAVQAGRQGVGHGTAMMRHVENALAARGARILLVETSGLEAFEPQRAFYRGLGYEQEARIRDFYDAGEDKIVFRKALGAG